MKKNTVFYLGLLGVILFVVTSLIGGLLIDEYSLVKQLISETYAIDTQYGLPLRLFGFIPSGIFLSLFCFFAAKQFNNLQRAKLGFYGVGIFYGIATIVVSIFPCDSGCNKQFINPSISQIVHNLSGLLTYTLVPFFILLIGFHLIKTKHSFFAKQSIILGGVSSLFVLILFLNVNSNYIGLHQRMVEFTFLLWIILCAFSIKNIHSIR